MYSSYFWFNVPLPEELTSLPSTKNSKERMLELDFVKRTFAQELIADDANFKLGYIALSITGSTTFNREKSIRQSLLKIYEKLHTRQSSAHGVAYFLDWDGCADDKIRYQAHKFVNGKSDVSECDFSEVPLS